MKRSICLLFIIILTTLLYASPPVNPFIGTWEGSIEGFDFNIVFMYDNMCIITVKVVQDGREITEETNGTYSYDDIYIRINGTFNNSRIQGLGRINWYWPYAFVNNNNTTFRMRIIPPGSNSRTLVTFFRTFS